MTKLTIFLGAAAAGWWFLLRPTAAASPNGGIKPPFHLDKYLQGKGIGTGDSPKPPGPL